MSYQEQKKKKKLRQRQKERRKKDCMIGVPFLVAFQGDPARSFYCNDVKDVNGNHTYELIHEHYRILPFLREIMDKPLERLLRYAKEPVHTINGKVLICNAGEVKDPYLEQKENEENDDCVEVLVKLAQTPFEKECVTEFIALEKDISVKFAAIKANYGWIKYLCVGILMTLVGYIVSRIFDVVK